MRTASQRRPQFLVEQHPTVAMEAAYRHNLVLEKVVEMAEEMVGRWE